MERERNIGKPHPKPADVISWKGLDPAQILLYLPDLRPASAFVILFLPFGAEDMILSLLSCLGGDDKHGRIVLELAEPALEVGNRIVENGGRVNPNAVADEAGGHFSHKLFHAVVLAAESIHAFRDTLSGETTLVASGVSQFMEQGGVVVLGGQELGDVRHDHMIGLRRVVCRVSFRNDRTRTVAGDHRFGYRDLEVLPFRERIVERKRNLLPFMELSQVEFLEEPAATKDRFAGLLVFIDDPLHDRRVRLVRQKFVSVFIRLLPGDIERRREAGHGCHQKVDTAERLLVEQVHRTELGVAVPRLVPGRSLGLFHVLRDDGAQNCEDLVRHFVLLGES